MNFSIEEINIVNNIYRRNYKTICTIGISNFINFNITSDIYSAFITALKLVIRNNPTSGLLEFYSASIYHTGHSTIAYQSLVTYILYLIVNSWDYINNEFIGGSWLYTFYKLFTKDQLIPQGNPNCKTSLDRLKIKYEGEDICHSFNSFQYGKLVNVISIDKVDNYDNYTSNVFNMYLVSLMSYSGVDVANLNLYSLGYIANKIDIYLASRLSGYSVPKIEPDRLIDQSSRRYDSCTSVSNLDNKYIVEISSTTCSNVMTELDNSDDTYKYVVVPSELKVSRYIDYNDSNTWTTITFIEPYEASVLYAIDIETLINIFNNVIDNIQSSALITNFWELEEFKAWVKKSAKNVITNHSYSFCINNTIQRTVIDNTQCCWNDVAFFGNDINKFLAIEIYVNSSSITSTKYGLSSDNGLTWTLYNKPRPEYTNVVVFNLSSDVIVLYGATSNLAVSTDGINWTEYSCPFGVNNIYSFYYANGKYFALYNNKMYYTTDIALGSASWTMITITSGSMQFRCAGFGNGRHIVGSVQYCYYSDDDFATINSIAGLNNLSLYAAIYFNNRWTLVTYQGVKTSVSGIDNFTNVTDESSLCYNNLYKHIVTKDSRLYLVNYNCSYYIWKTLDGLTFEEVYDIRVDDPEYKYTQGASDNVIKIILGIAYNPTANKTVVIVQSSNYNTTNTIILDNNLIDI
jgi:hypothetical protein